MIRNAQQFIPRRCGAQNIHRELIPSIDQSLIREELRDLRQLLKNRVERKLDDVDGGHGRSTDTQKWITSLFQIEIVISTLYSCCFDSIRVDNSTFGDSFSCTRSLVAPTTSSSPSMLNI